MRNRSNPDRTRTSRVAPKSPRASGETPDLSTPFPWTDRDLAFNARDALRRPAPDADEIERQRAGSVNTSLRDEVAHRLLAEAGEGAHAVKITVDDGIVTLDGPVPQRFTKDMVEAIVEAVPGVRGVDNRLCVDWVDGTPSVDRIGEAPPPPRKDYLTSTQNSPTSTGKRN
jgi:hypothetical protein